MVSIADGLVFSPIRVNDDDEDDNDNNNNNNNSNNNTMMMTMIIESRERWIGVKIGRSGEGTSTTYLPSLCQSFSLTCPLHGHFFEQR